MYALRLRLAGVGLGLAFLATTGCNTVPRQEGQLGDGPEVQILLTREILPTALTRYRSIEFRRATTTLGGSVCPPMVIATYDRTAAQVARGLRDVFPGGRPRLTVDTEIQFFQKKSLIGTAQFLARVTICDENRIVADTVVNAQTRSLREGVGYDLAEQAAVAVGGWLRSRKAGQ